MTPLQFIKAEIGELAKNFPNIHIRYAFDDSIDTHIIQLDPVREYWHNDQLDEAWIPVSLRFNELFNDDCITFISSDSSLRIESPEIEWNQPLQGGWALDDYNSIIEKVLEFQQICFTLPEGDILWEKVKELNVISEETLSRIQGISEVPQILNLNTSDTEAILISELPRYQDYNLMAA